MAELYVKSGLPDHNAHAYSVFTVTLGSDAWHKRAFIDTDGFKYTHTYGLKLSEAKREKNIDYSVMSNNSCQRTID